MFLIVFHDLGGPGGSRMPLGASLEKGPKKVVPPCPFWGHFGRLFWTIGATFGDAKFGGFLHALPDGVLGALGAQTPPKKEAF